MQNYLFKNINIIGLGLIGGSIAKACKKYEIGKKIYGYDVNPVVTNFAIHKGVTDGIYDFKQSDADDLIIICSPLSSYQEVFRKLLPIQNQATIIDIGSLKEVALQFSHCTPLSHFIPCHPIAGSEKSGFENSDSELFVKKKAIIINDVYRTQDRLKKVELFWKRIGSEPEFMNAKEHDKIFALVSHLPQFLSFAAKEYYKNDDEILNKHLRLQNSNPQIWQEIFSLNKKNIEHYSKFFLENVDKLIKNLESKNLDCHAIARNDDVSSFNNEPTKPSLRGDLAPRQSSLENYFLILKRFYLTSCFLNIPDIKSFEKHAGSGFRDFTAIVAYEKFLKDNPQILEDNRESLIKFLNEIKSKITNYDK